VSQTLTPSSKRSGEDVEHLVIERVDALNPVADEVDRGHDAVATRAIAPSEALPLATPLLLPGRPVEIKAAQTRLASGARGRWYLRQRQHESLVDAGGYYVLACYAPVRPTHEIRGLVGVPASIVDEHLPDGWIDVEDDERREEGYRQLAWSRLIDPETVLEGRR
jgi:hypothetical protein